MRNVMRCGIGSWRPRFWLRNLRQLCRNLKFAYQRVTRGYSDLDVWNLDDFLTQVIADGTRQLSETANGISNYHYDASKEDEGYGDWVAYLKEMSTHFQNSIDDVENPYEFNDKRWYDQEIKNAKFQDDEFQKGWEMLHKVYHELWD